MVAHTLSEEAFSVFHAVAQGGSVKIAVAQEGYGTDDEFRHAVFVTQEQYFVFRGKGTADDMDIHGLEYGLRGIEERGGIVVASDKNEMAAEASGNFSEEVVVHGLCLIGGEAAVEDVSGNEEHIGGFFPYSLRQPAQEETEFVVALSAVERMSEMPVRGMEYFQSIFSHVFLYHASERLSLLYRT